MVLGWRQTQPPPVWNQSRVGVGGPKKRPSRDGDQRMIPGTKNPYALKLPVGTRREAAHRPGELRVPRMVTGHRGATELTGHLASKPSENLKGVLLDPPFWPLDTLGGRRGATLFGGYERRFGTLSSINDCHKWNLKKGITWPVTYTDMGGGPSERKEDLSNYFSSRKDRWVKKNVSCVEKKENSW